MRIDITDTEAGARLDKLLILKVPGLGRAASKRLFAEGRVRIRPGGGERSFRAAKGDVASSADVIELDLEPTQAAAGCEPDPEAPFLLVLETPEVVIADKPAGQPSAPLAPGERGTLANALVGRYPELAGIGFSPREPGLCHRLDTGTSGLLLAARTEAAFTTLTTGLKEGKLDKRYLLICKAADLPEAGTIDIPLAPHPKDRRRVYACVHPRDVVRYAPRPASTSYTKVREQGEWALVEVKAPRAARHQIRAHFAAIEHPLAGDRLYGGAEVPGFGDDEGARHALHAYRITWPGDKSVPAFSVESPLPKEMAALVGE